MFQETGTMALYNFSHNPQAMEINSRSRRIQITEKDIQLGTPRDSFANFKVICNFSDRLQIGVGTVIQQS